MDKTFLQKNLTTILIVGATIILGGIAIFTAIRLYQLRGQPVAPNVPESSPSAANEGVVLTIPIDTVAFGPEDRELIEPLDVRQYSGLVCTVTATSRNQESVHPNNNLIVSSGSGSVIVEDVEREAGGVITASGVLTLGNSISVTLDMGPDQVFSGGLDVSLDCVVPTASPSPTPEPSLTSCTELVFSLSSATPTSTPTNTPTTTPTATPTATSTATPTSTSTATPASTPAYPCNSTCTSDSQCQMTDSNYICYSQSGSQTKTCRHEDYPTQTNCQPPATSTVTATPASLPQAGVSLPTVLGLGAGALLLIIALAFAL